MPETIINRILYPDKLEIGSPSKGGSIVVHFDASDLSEAQMRIDNAVAARQHLLNRLSQGGARV